MGPGARSAMLVALALGALAPSEARAHEVGLSRGDYTLAEDPSSGGGVAIVRGRIIFARRELIGLVAGLDADHDGHLTTPEIEGAKDAILGAVVGRIVVTSDGARCTEAVTGVELTEQDGAAIDARWTCAARPRKLAVTFGLLEDLAFGHRHLARVVVGPAPMDAVLSQRSPTIAVDVPPSPTSSGSPGAAATTADLVSSPLRGARAALRPEGPLFLIGVLVTLSTLRAAIGAATAFIAAAVVGVTLGATGAFLPSPAALGAALAISMVYAGLDAWGPARGDRRAWIALPFGVVNGLALASVSASGASLVPYAAGGLLALAAITLAVAPLARSLGRALRAKAWGPRAFGGALALAGILRLVLAHT